MNMSIPLKKVMFDIEKAETMREASYILHNHTVNVDARKKTDPAFPVGLFDIITFPEINEAYTIVINSWGKLVLKKLNAPKSDKKLIKIVNKRKVKGNKGEIEVFFKMILEIDSKEEWNKTSFFKSKYFMKWFFNKGYKDEIDRQIVDASGEVEKFQSMIKQFLGIKPFVKDFSGVPFHPVKGYE